MKPLNPSFVEPGATARVFAPAGRVHRTVFEDGLSLLGTHFTVHVPAAVMAQEGYLAGPDAVRRSDFQDAMGDRTADVLIAARGGYGTTRILDSLDWSPLTANPRWVVGSSDLTALLIHLWQQFRMNTIHGPMVEGLGKSAEDREHLVALLGGRPMPPCVLEGLCDGEVCAPMVGGNLTVLAHLAGGTEPFANGCILFLEDVAESPYRVDRCLTQLRRAGLLHGVKGFVLGEFTNCAPGSDGFSVEDVLTAHLGGLGVPLATGYPAAHGARNRPFVHGGTVQLAVKGSVATLA